MEVKKKLNYYFFVIVKLDGYLDYSQIKFDIVSQWLVLWFINKRKYKGNNLL